MGGLNQPLGGGADCMQSRNWGMVKAYPADDAATKEEELPMQNQSRSIPVVLTVTLLLGVGSLVAATPISCGMIIDTPGQYHLSSESILTPEQQ